MFVINKIFIKIWYFFRKYHRKNFINYFKKNGVYNYIHNVNKKGLQFFRETSERIWAYNSINFPCQTLKKLFFYKISGDKFK